MWVQPTVDELETLARKYELLAELRRRKDTGTAPASRCELRGLATQFPGCLRELDTLGLLELQRRAAVARAAAKDGPDEPWIAWIWRYHAVMRATLDVKAALGRETAPTDGEARFLARAASRIAGLPLAPAFVRAVAEPPYGRLGVVVLRQLGAAFGVPADAIARALFPLRRPSPYRL